MTTLISHIYNEEFLLPFFIKQHYSKFDHGIILDFGSTDESKSIIKRMAPNWQIIDCSEYSFSAIKLDNLVTELESEIQGICLTLTVTEFLIGDPRLISKEAIIPTVSLLRLPEEPEISLGQKFHDVYKNGIFPFSSQSHSETEWMARKKGRRISVLRSPYPVGRHFDLLGDSLLLIYRVSNCLANEKMLKRRLQIQDKIPVSDKVLGLGVQHTDYGKTLTRESLLKTIEIEVDLCTNLGDYIQFFLDIEKMTLDKEVTTREFQIIRNIFSKFESNQSLLLEAKTNISMVRELESRLNSSSNLISEIERELESIKNSQNRPSQNLRNFLLNVTRAIKVRCKMFVQKLSR
jgi:hypothetical protein